MKYRAKIGSATLSLTLTPSETAVEINNSAKSVRLNALSPSGKHSDYITLTLDGINYRGEVVFSGETVEVKLADGRRFSVELTDEKQLLLESLGVKSGAKKSSGVIKSPMPGLVFKLNVAVGDSVTAGQCVAVLEAMKMQNDIKSLVSGTVKEIMVKEKQAVEKNQPLLKIE